MSKTPAVAAVMVETNSLVEWSRNPRHNVHAVEAVAESIQRYGFATPIVARKADRRIIAGHTRYLAAKKLGLGEVPVRFLDLSEKDADALGVADNRLSELATWDEDILSELVAEFQGDGVDLDALGFSDDEVKALLGEWKDPFLEEEQSATVASGEAGDVVDVEDGAPTSEGVSVNTSGQGSAASSLVIVDKGQSIIYVTVPVTSGQDAGRIIAQALKDGNISHTIRVK